MNWSVNNTNYNANDGCIFFGVIFLLLPSNLTTCTAAYKFLVLFVRGCCALLIAISLTATEAYLHFVLPLALATEVPHLQYVHMNTQLDVKEIHLTDGKQCSPWLCPPGCSWGSRGRCARPCRSCRSGVKCWGWTAPSWPDCPHLRHWSRQANEAGEPGV